jgi:hypothetical protein
MDQTTLVMPEIDAGAELVRRLDRSVPVRAAFWVKDSEEGQWYLYIASDQLEEKSLDVGYGEVLRLAHEMANPFLDPFQVKLISSRDPLAHAALEVLHRYPGPMATRFGGRNFGGLSVDGVYIYPSSVTTLSP